jgi:hypothetical protein
LEGVVISILLEENLSLSGTFLNIVRGLAEAFRVAHPSTGDGLGFRTDFKCNINRAVLLETNTLDVDLGFTSDGTSLGGDGVDGILGSGDLGGVEAPHVVQPFVVPTTVDNNLILVENHLARVSGLGHDRLGVRFGTFFELKLDAFTRPGITFDVKDVEFVGE